MNQEAGGQVMPKYQVALVLILREPIEATSKEEASFKQMAFPAPEDDRWELLPDSTLILEVEDD